MGSTRRVVTLENCLDFAELKKDLARIGFADDPKESDWNVLVVRKTRSPIHFSAEVYNDITKVPSGKAYAQVFMNYAAPLKPLPSLERMHSLAPPLDALLTDLSHVNFDRIVGHQSARTNVEHQLGYQLGITVKAHAAAELRGVVCDVLKYFSAYTEKKAKAIKK